jgi:hypothetical protein
MGMVPFSIKQASAMVHVAPPELGSSVDALL